MGLRFVLDNPNVPTCGDCKKWMYDLDTGEIQIHRGKPLARPSNLGTPCESCPRKGPQFEAETTLTEKNWRAYEFYTGVRATNSLGLTRRQRFDPLTRKILSTIDTIVRGRELTAIVNAGALTAQMAQLGR